MFSLIRDAKGILKILEPNEKYKIINNRFIQINDPTYTTLLKSYNRFYLASTKMKLESQLKVVLNSEDIDKNHYYIEARTTDTDEPATDDFSPMSNLNENQFDEVCSEHGDYEPKENYLATSDDDDDEDDSSEIFSNKDYSSSESEFDVESTVNSDDEFGYESDDSLMDTLRNDTVKSIQLPNISVSPISSGKGLASSSLLENSSAHSVSVSLPDEVAVDPDYVPETISNVSTAEITNKENENINSKTHNNASVISQIINANIQEYVDNVEPPNYEMVTIEPVQRSNDNSPRKRKLHECVFCGKDQSHLKRHLERKHKNEPAVQNMKKLSANAKGSRNPMKELLYAGDIKHNSDITKFKGQYRVARKPKLAPKLVSDYAACSKCKAMILVAEYRKHVTVCANISGKDCRNLKYLGKNYIRNCHPRANNKMRKQILSRMRDDKVLRTVKYDALLVEYGNEICEHLRGNQHKTNICAKLRRLGRLKVAMNVKNFQDFLVPGESLNVVKAIELMASDPDNPDSDYLKHPTLAENLATLVKQVARTHSILCLRNNEHEVRKTTQEFLECFENDYRTRLSRMASESHGKFKREKVVQLPSAEDIRKLYDYLSHVRKTNYNNLEIEFDEASYLTLLKSTLTALQVFNSRRPGDVERIFLNEYRNRQKIGQEQGLNYHTLPENIQDLANEFSLIHTRGKWGNDIKLLVPLDVQLCINKLIELRPQMNISSKNNYVFALPKTPLAEIRHPSAYVLLSRFAQLCGAENPKLLRATAIRKNLATRCIELNLSDAELTDLAAYMGHHVDIHKSHYRRNIVARDIPLFLKFVNKALEVKKSKETSDSESDEPDTHNDSNVENVNHSIPDINEKSTHDVEANESENLSANALADNSLQNDGVPLPSTKKRSKKSLKSRKSNDSCQGVQAISRPRWTKSEIQIIRKEFEDFFNGKTDATPSEKIRKMMDENPTHFRGRTDKAIRTWMRIQKAKN